MKIGNEYPFKPSGIKGYSSIKKLRKECEQWKKYYKDDPKSALKITEEKFIIKAQNYILTPMDDEFNKVSYKLIKHTVFGELDKEIKGIHLISVLNSKIKSVIQKAEENSYGIWKADIEYYSPERDKVYWKRNSTMFPKKWSPTEFIFKIYSAYKRKYQCKIDEEIYHSVTDCGIYVDFVIKNGILKTVYPLYIEK